MCFQKFKCKFCNEILEYGFDKNNLMHCQYCHNIWDGYSQCICYITGDDTDKDDGDST